MASKAIMVRQVVYRALEEQKRRGESFSKVIERLLSRGPGLASLRGLWVRGEAPRERERRVPGRL
jgi:predicted CopG family antitoxin